MSTKATRRGQPVVALALVLSSWVAARALMWEPAPALPSPLPAPSAPPVLAMPAAPAEIAPPAISDAPQSPTAARPRPVPFHLIEPLPTVPQPVVEALPEPAEPVRVAVGHHLLWMAAVSLVRMPDLTATPAPPPPVPYIARDSGAPKRRWSADGWMMLRHGGVPGPATGPARATYGASQLGAVVRYRLAPDSPHRPTAYLRGTAALVSPFDKEAATGISARPVGGIPLTLAAELRAGELSSRFRVRPAVVAVTELQPQKLPFDLRAEAYAQAGYVGGKGATPFIDGQLRVDRAIAHVGKSELRAGGGAWGGAQEGASRVDVGPVATVGIPLSGVASARIAFDWRFKAAGNAVPQSGPALTLSAGF
jgi:hypothetical protein